MSYPTISKIQRSMSRENNAPYSEKNIKDDKDDRGAGTLIQQETTGVGSVSILN